MFRFYHDEPGFRESMIGYLEEALRTDRPVYVDAPYRNLKAHFPVREMTGGGQYRLAPLP